MYIAKNLMINLLICKKVHLCVKIYVKYFSKKRKKKTNLNPEVLNLRVTILEAEHSQTNYY